MVKIGDEKDATVSPARNNAANKEKTSLVRVEPTSKSSSVSRLSSLHEGKVENKSVVGATHVEFTRTKRRKGRRWEVFSCGRLVNRRIFFIVCPFNSVRERLFSSCSKNLNNNFPCIYCVSRLRDIFVAEKNVHVCISKPRIWNKKNILLRFIW